MNWTDSAACKNHPYPDWWFPKEKGRGNSEAAKAICATCSVRGECLAYALANGERYGVWGGLSEDERRSRRPRPRALAPVDLGTRVDLPTTVNGHPGPQHGRESAYIRYGCRCPDCVTYMRVRWRKLNERRREAS